MSTRSLNKVMLIGNLTRDPNMRFTPTNTAVCSFSIATNRSWTPSDGGEKQERADYHNIVAWSKLAEVCGQLLKKGDKVYVEGRMQTREWKGKDELDHRTTEVVIDTMILLTSRGGASSYQSQDEASGMDDSQQSAPRKAAPAKVPKKKKDEDEGNVSDDVSAVEDISDEVDIPF